jgi:hypothetical protein
MVRTHVISSNLESVGYDTNSKTLEIAFIGGGIYQYFAVPYSVFSALMNATSKGTYFANSIKNVYRYQKVG